MVQSGDYKFRFIHASDTHLGSIIHASFKASNKIEEALKDAVYSSFKRICDAAIDNKVDFLILSGDIYDRELATVKGSRILYEESKRLEEQGINIYMIRGNHDPMGDGEELFTLPSNVHTFSCEKAESLQITKNKKVVGRIIGQSYKSKWERKDMASSYNLDNDGLYNIGVLHTALEDNNSNYVPCSIEKLKEKNIHYWALGHIHKCKIINVSKPVIAYSGNPQGRDIGEEGIGGALLVEVKEDLSESIKFIPTSEIIWRRISLNINEYKETPTVLNELEELLIEKGEEILNINLEAPEALESIYHMEKLVKGYIIQWNIEGRGEIDSILRQDEAEIEKDLKDTLNKHFLNRSPFLFTHSILVNTSKEIPNMDYILENNKVIKEANEIAKLYLEEDMLKKEIISYFGNIFETNHNSEDINEEKIQLYNELIEEIIKNAKELVIEKFLEKGEGF